MPFAAPPSPVKKKAPKPVSKERKAAIEELAGYLGESPDKLLPISQQEKEAIISAAIETPEGRSLLAIQIVEAIDEQR
jgi:hypothetical protein